MSRASRLIMHAASLRSRMWGESVTYVRKSTGAELPVTARRSGVQTAGPNGDGIAVSVEHVNWVIAAELLIDGGDCIEPSPGDSIVVVGSFSTVTYLVGTYAGEQSCWEPADSHHAELIIHTKIWSES